MDIIFCSFAGIATYLKIVCKWIKSLTIETKSAIFIIDLFSNMTLIQVSDLLIIGDCYGSPRVNVTLMYYNSMISLSFLIRQSKYTLDKLLQN
jgi:hypothetical protein